MWTSVLSIVSALLKLCGWGAAEIHDAEQRQQGAVKQDDADKTIALAQDARARQIDEDVAALPDDELRRRLSGPGAHP